MILINKNTYLLVWQPVSLSSISPCVPYLPRASHSICPVQLSVLEVVQRDYDYTVILPRFSRCPQHTHSASPMNSDWISFPFKLLATSSIFSIIVSVQLLYFKIALLLVFLIIKIVTQSIMRILSFLSSHQGPTIALLPNIFFLFSSQHRTSSHPQPSNPGSSLMAVTPPHLHTNDFQATCLALVCRFPSTNNSLATFTAPFKCTSHINRHGSFYIGLTFLKN